MYRKRALVVGVTGIVGLNLAEHLHALGGWEIPGVSRRQPAGHSYVKWRAVHLLDPTNRPTSLRPWGATLHDEAMLPSALWADLEQVLAELAAAGLPLDPAPFRTIWEWRFPVLLHWRQGAAELTIRQALEPWPLLCDTPVEGGSTSRFVDSSLRRFEVITTAAFRQQHRLQLQARPLQLPSGGAERPVAVRYRQEALFPCLHPCLPVQIPLQLDLLAASGGQPLRSLCGRQALQVGWRRCRLRGGGGCGDGGVDGWAEGVRNVSER